MIRRIKIGVIADTRRQFHHDIFLRVKNPTAQFVVVTQSWRLGGEKMLNDFARFAPRRTSQREKRVQGILRKHMSIMKLGRAKMTELFQDRKIDNQIADRDSDARFALFRLKDAEWEILDGKMRIGWNFDKTA